MLDVVSGQASYPGKVWTNYEGLWVRLYLLQRIRSVLTDTFPPSPTAQVGSSSAKSRRRQRSQCGQRNLKVLFLVRCSSACFQSWSSTRMLPSTNAHSPQNSGLQDGKPACAFA